MQYHALPALKGLPTNTEKGFSTAMECILGHWKTGFCGMHSQVWNKLIFIQEFYKWYISEEIMQKLGWYNYISEQYKYIPSNIPSNSPSDLFTVGKKDEEHFISRVSELEIEISFIRCWLSYAFYTR